MKLNRRPARPERGSVARVAAAAALASAILFCVSPAAAGTGPAAERGAVKPLEGRWSGKTEQRDPSIPTEKLEIRFDVVRKGKARFVYDPWDYSDWSEVVVRCVTPDGPFTAISPVSFPDTKVRKGSFEAEVKVPGSYGYHDTITGKFESKREASGTLRSRWTGGRDCDSGKVKWTAKLRSESP